MITIKFLVYVFNNAGFYYLSQYITDICSLSKVKRAVFIHKSKHVSQKHGHTLYSVFGMYYLAGGYHIIPAELVKTGFY